MVERTVLSCRGLRKSFGDLVAVDGIGFDIAEGETYGLLGPNGAGKTTAISMIAGILQPDAGDVFVDARVVTTSGTGPKALIGYVPQDLAIYPDLTGRENLLFFARLYGLSGAEARHRVSEVLDVIGLADRAKDMAKQYSGGMRRRLNIGIGLLHRPRLLVLDEPTAGVDPQSRNAILDSVGQLAADGLAVLYTTHYMEEAERLCDRVGIIDGGRLVAEGTQRELVALVRERDHIVLTVSGDPGAVVNAMRSVPEVRDSSSADSTVELLVDDAAASLPVVLNAVSAAGVPVRAVTVAKANLETVFLHLTGKALRE
jgi:ABC-2 type transport system ATP-binding protein